jgi:class 3 adenylate cyclase
LHNQILFIHLPQTATNTYFMSKIITLTLLFLFLIGINEDTFAQRNKRQIAAKIKEFKLKRRELLRAKDFEETVKITWRIAASYNELKQDGIVASEYLKAVEYANMANNPKLHAYAYERLGDNFDNIKFHTKKIQNYEQASSRYKEAKLLENYAIVLQKIAKYAYEVKKYSPMINAVEDLLENADEYKLSHLEKEAYCKMMIEAQTEEKNDESIKFYDKILDELMKTPNREKLITLGKKKASDTEDVDMMLISKRETDILRKFKNRLSEEVDIQAESIQRQKDSLKQQEDKIAQQKTAIKMKDLEVEAQEARKNQLLFGILGAVALLIVSGIAFMMQLKAKKKVEQKNIEIEAQKQVIELERQKSDDLLLNILPLETANELKEKGKATPRSYEMVTVLFTDFKGFTNIAEKMTAEQVIAELDYCFLNFDKIVDKYNLEKIKTIGDAYMCAGGIPVANTTNPYDAVMVGLEMQAFMHQWKEAKKAKNEPYFELRLGIHTGKVVAGVVGTKKFAYDIWGDAVNIAARMESSGEVAKVNISGTTYELVKDKFTATHRGKIPAKNKGEIDMYFIEKKI